MENQADAREKRWIILTEDGRHGTIGRHTDPTEAEILKHGEALARQGIGGWLAISEGSYYANVAVSLLQVRVLGTPSTTWEQAVQSYQDRRKANLVE